MKIEFTKMHGAGNDYIYVDCLDNQFPGDPVDSAIRMSDRHFGIGADGLILILPADNPSEANCRMRMFNADGSESEMCGNGIRCVAKFVHDHGRVNANPLKVQTGVGILSLDLNPKGGLVESVTVNMGLPRMIPSEVPVNLPGEKIIEHDLMVNDRMFKVNCVSMGNPHAVIFIDEPVEDFPLEHYGPLIENHELFPRRTNVEFINVRGPQKLRQRTWERGSGETLACGTGASAVAVASIETGRCKPGKVEIELNGGKIEIEWSPGNEVLMTGPAVEVFNGTWRE